MGGNGVQMSRYFVNRTQIEDNRIKITGEDYQHLKKVLRAVKGDTVTVCCEGTDYTSVIDEIGNDCIYASITDKAVNVTESSLRVTLFQGLPKADKMELIVQKCIELGISEIVPVITERSIVKINSGKDAQAKVSRWQKIALEAAKQCNRGLVPVVGMPVKFAEAVAAASHKDLAIIPYEKESSVGFKEIVSACSNTKSAAIFIGPEGGFTEQEIELADSRGIRKMTLGPRILRTETAGIVALSLMMYELGDVSNGRT
ncbi:ribosomal RNA small subunit methyltransferase E [Ruminiclostridium hungatei]|uniref:Ribosomal RNA small subunit methyltransferase E n=2 Tax=Ruminiclostridium hungatei TaxID=48256 RepID=A0A1V4SHD5_RUMHU|nr:ribosomal RNA small subunit methyltransferase E [Ruminiclostridium hungatei]